MNYAKAYRLLEQAEDALERGNDRTALLLVEMAHKAILERPKLTLVYTRPNQHEINVMLGEEV